MEKFFNTGPKLRVIMKLLGVPVVIILLVASLTLAKDGNAQDLMKRSVTIEFTNREITKVLTSIGHKTNVRFTYLPGIFPVNAKVSLKLKNVPLEAALRQLLTPYNINYQTSGEFIILRKNMDASKSSVTNTKTEVLRTDDITISGKVTDDKGESLPGVSIILKGTQRGTVTDIDGAFSFNVPDKDAVLVFSYVGYLQKEVEVGSQASVNVQLLSDNKVLEEVVVVGYGTQKKSDVTGAIASLDGTKITRAATPDASGALQGQMPGVVVVKNVGKPGSGYSINIRGVSSIGGSNSPLFVIDGIPTTTGINELNPADIEKIDVLKDASATAIYGSRGAKGVVIVTTKRGKSGKTTISYDAYAGVRTPTNLPRMFDGPEYVAYRTDQFKAQGKDVSRNNAAFFTPEQWKNIDEGKFTDWPSLLLRNGLQMNHNITASGGDEKTRFAISAGLLQEDGNVKPEQFKRYTLRGNVDRQITAKWKAGLNIYFSQNLQDLGSSEALRSAYRLPPMTNPYDASGARVFRVYGTNSVSNPMFDQENEIRQNRNARTFGNIYVQLQPTAHLTLKSSISPNYSTERRGTYFGPLAKQTLGGALPTSASNATSEQLTWVLDNQATYDRQFGLHRLTATAVQSLQKDRFESNTISVEGLPYRSLWYNLATAGKVTAYGSAYTKTTLSSAMGRINYSYKDKYLLTATGRWDGSSRLAEGNQWGFFPSASLAWRLSEEQFIKSVPAINDLKLRVSYGVTGNDRVNPYSTQATLGQTFYDFGGVFAQGYAPSQLANKALTWETTNEINVGLDFGFFSNRVSGSVDVYNRLIDNILLSRQLPAPSGYSSITDNVGKLKNSGIELGVSTINIHAGKFMWKSDLVFDKNKNEILQLNGGKKDDVGNKLFIGHPAQVNYNYVFDGIWQQAQIEEAKKYNQTPGQVRVKDIDGNGIINASDRQIIGKQVPSWTGSFSNTFKYGNFDLFIMVYTRRGEQFESSFDATLLNYNQDYNQVKVDYWTPANASQVHFQPGNPGPYSVIPTFRKVDFTRVGNITLGYNLPSDLIKKIRISSLRIYATATNPILFTKYDGFDPEWPAVNTYGTAVSTSSYLFGINLAF